MCDGKWLSKIETVDERGEKVLEGSAEVAQATTVCVHWNDSLHSIGLTTGD
jgi:hypothetical protein